MEEKKLTEEESMNIIQQMIQTAKDDHRENGEDWLVWGWLLFVASLASVVLAYLDLNKYIGLVWSGMLLIVLIGYLVTYLQSRKTPKVKTYVQELLNRFGHGFFISLFAMIAASMMSRATFAFGYFYILYAFWMFIHGSAIRFKPLIVGAFVNWAAAMAIFMINEFKYDMMVSAIAILAGYLVPGYLLRSQYRRGVKTTV